MSFIQAEAEEWQHLIGQQDDFVARLLQQKQEWKEKGLSTATTNSSNATPVGAGSENLEALREYAEHLEKRIHEMDAVHSEQADRIATLTTSQQSDQSRIESMQAALNAASRSQSQPQPQPEPQNSYHESPASTDAAKKFFGPPYLLVLIDGSSAPFADGLISQGKTGGLQAATQVRWEVEKDIRAFDVVLDVDGEGSKIPEVVAIIFYNKARLIDSLIKARVISSPHTWEEFALAFNSRELSQLIDCGDHPIEEKVAAFIKLFGPTPSLKRLYLVGVFPDALFVAAADLDPRGKEPLAQELKSKIVLVNHRETESDLIELKKYKWRVTTFARFFSPNGGLGGDWGLSTGGEDTYTPGREYDAVTVDKRMSGTGNWGGSGSGAKESWKTQQGKKKTRKVALQVDTSKKYYFQDPQLEALRQEIRTIPCKAELREPGSCAWERENGVPCMFSHSFFTKKSKRQFRGPGR
ncbi:hypothetical protein RQP46_009135 [Phenoliferia psychrophenolica]